MIEEKSYHCVFITPCFCTGANPAKAEVRAPSIRGKLRWWFRILGGTLKEEQEVFGGSDSDGKPIASRVVIRSVLIGEAPAWKPPELPGMVNRKPHPLSYLLYFAKASSEQKRWNPEGALAPGTEFRLSIGWRRSLPDKRLANLFQLSLEAFLLLGSLGLRSTRGLGAFSCREMPPTEDSLNLVCGKVLKEAPSFAFQWSNENPDQGTLLKSLGRELQSWRKDFPAGKPPNSKPSPLGSSSPRQASALYLRPVELPEGFQILLFEAPHEKVLGPKSRTGKVLSG